MCKLRCRKHNNVMVYYQTDYYRGWYCPECEKEDLEEVKKVFGKDRKPTTLKKKNCVNCGIVIYGTHRKKYCKTCGDKIRKEKAKIITAKRDNDKYRQRKRMLYHKNKHKGELI